MKIKEAVNRIESTSKSIFAWEREGYIHIAFNTFTVLVVPYEAKTMFDCHFVNPNLELPADVKAQLSGIIGKFLRTPIKERYPDKKYRLRWISDKDNCKNYLDYSSGMWDFVESKNEATIFAESGLNQLKKDNPRLAPAIDAMKEEVKDDE
ncbi:hypothetical protein LMB96_05370 [Limosilactobacillus reuteri]|uniref:hypothetical protein n=1 Tax=Limosilactobacillus reuteri TaxID=1598 RepID=UPI001E2C1423|nr:hypothetical protein [Limosilactobacillus reuteri]MCC4421763.1 hypothetical protein [Limosilactobacillus reuteri]